jgi:hypothetical protein
MQVDTVIRCYTIIVGKARRRAENHHKPREDGEEPRRRSCVDVDSENTYHFVFSFLLDGDW